MATSKIGRAASLGAIIIALGAVLALGEAASAQAPAAGQVPASAPTTPQGRPAGQTGASFLFGRPEPSRHAASNAASSRAMSICAGMWSGHQPLDQLKRDLLDAPAPGASPLTDHIDYEHKTVSVDYDPAMPPRIVVWRNVLGCVQLPVGATMDDAKYLPQVDASLQTPNLDDQAWPMGDRDATAKLGSAKQAAVDAIVANAFDGKTYGGTTWGVIVVKDGKIIAERYDRGFDMHMGSQTHSAAKSFAGSLVGIAVGEGLVDLHKQGVLAEWRKPGDPRGKITLDDLEHMASGLYGEGSGNQQVDIYFQGATVADRAATNVLDTEPGTRFLYNPPDTMLSLRVVREAMNDDHRFLAFPYQSLFWKIGMTRTVTSGDWNGDFMMSGETWSTARDFARFGLLYLNDGVWDGQRILPEGWAKYVATPAPMQPPPGGPRYGAQFWIYGGLSGLPADAYSPGGGMGQYAMIIPSKHMVVVRRGWDEASQFQIAKFCADVIAAAE